MLAQGILAVVLGMTLGCGANSPAGPTATVMPARAAPAAVYTVTASTNMVSPGGELGVSWTTSAGGHNDWIALFTKGTLNNGPSWWVGWTDGVTSGTFTLNAPGRAGQYEFRYLLDDGYLDGATSSLLTVGAAP
jgi:hypothetical protein